MNNKYNALINELEQLYQITPRHIDGNIMGSMTTWPHPVGVKAFLKFIHVNGNDPFTFHVVAECEEKLIREVGGLFNAKVGLHTSGGTESNILAVFAAMKTTGSNVVIAPSTVHRSIDKACELMNCKLIKITTHPLKPVDPKMIKDHAVIHKPSLVVITAGTTETGVVDPVEEVAELAEKHGFLLHVDAAYGGLLIPFLKKHGLINTELKMTRGVSSITVDMHKNGMAPIPSSLLFLRDEELREKICFEMDYMPAGKSCGLLGTRPGGSVIAAYYTWKAVGLEGYEKNALRLMKLARKLYDELHAISEIEVYPFTLPIIAFRSRRYSSDYLLKILAERNIYLYKAPSLNALRVVLMPHHREHHVSKLINALRTIH
ncbi:MAG: aminotransferase class V-fold PLP-dependent enzyme [Desulfurococcaceae archaeon]